MNLALVNFCFEFKFVCKGGIDKIFINCCRVDFNITSAKYYPERGVNPLLRRINLTSVVKSGSNGITVIMQIPLSALAKLMRDVTYTENFSDSLLVYGKVSSEQGTSPM